MCWGTWESKVSTAYRLGPKPASHGSRVIPAATLSISTPVRREEKLFRKAQQREDEQTHRRSRPVDAFSKSHPGRARAQKEPAGSFSYLCPFHIALGPGVDPDHVARLYEQRYLDRGARLELGRFGSP